MCEPITLGSLALTGTQVAMTAAGAGLAIMGNAGAAQASTARNRQLGKQLRRQQMKVRGNTLMDRVGAYLRGVDAERYQSAAVIAASIGASKIQMAIHALIGEALLKKQEGYVKAITNKNLSKAAERGNQRSIDLALAAAGRAESAGRSKIDNVISEKRASLKDIYARANQAIQNKYQAIGILPEGDTGIMPTMDDVTWDTGQSALQQIANIGMGALQGYSMGSSLSAPNTGNLTPLNEWTTDMSVNAMPNNFMDNTALLTGAYP